MNVQKSGTGAPTPTPKLISAPSGTQLSYHASQGVDKLLSRLANVQRTGKQWSARCPAHDDQTNSLCIAAGADGRVLVYCHAGCATEDVVTALGMTMADLMPSANGNGNTKPKQQIVATYDYRDENGALQFQVVRYSPKDFRQRRPKKGGGWTWTVQGVRVVPYQLSVLLADLTLPVAIVEGEKDCENLASIDVLATCNAGGAGKWREQHAQYLRDRDVNIFSDNDEPGRKHAMQVARSLEGVARSIKIVKLPGLPPKGDVSDWLAAGGTKEQMMRLVDLAEEWKGNASINAATKANSGDLLAAMPEEARVEALAILKSRDLLERMIDDVAALGVAGEHDLIAAIILIGVSRLLPQPLAGIVQSPSSSGKSYVVEKSTLLFPPEAVIHATALSPNALFYMESGELRHRFIVAGERSRIDGDEAAEATRALREMISSGRLTKLVPVTVDGRRVTRKIDQDGPIAYIETTTLPKIFDEDSNRCLLLTADERQLQTAAVVNHLAEIYSGGIVSNVERIVARNHALQRMLIQRSVVIPYAHKIAERFDTRRVEARRAFPHFMKMVQASALLHQFQRLIDLEGRVVADIYDYRIARRLCLGPLARLLRGQTSDGALRFYDRLQKLDQDGFTTTEAVKAGEMAKSAVCGYLKELSEAGAVEQIDPPNGNRPAKWKLICLDRTELQAGDCGLPRAEEIEEQFDSHPGFLVNAAI